MARHTPHDKRQSQPFSTAWMYRPATNKGSLGKEEYNSPQHNDPSTQERDD